MSSAASNTRNLGTAVNPLIVSQSGAGLVQDLNGGGPIPIDLVSVTTTATIYAFTAQTSGKILAFQGCVGKPVTTTGKTAIFTPVISSVAVTGGALTATSTGLATIGTVVNATSITGGNSYVPGQLVGIKASNLTVFAEGQLLGRLFLGAP